jgi:UDP-N-acetylmuramyl pentapeptide phosphotransferase/UDP-N-acetylglucosamine-1-phosphate transferase
MLISEKSASGPPAASMSRFQFLIFTFVISLSLFLIVVSNAQLRQTDENAKRAADQTLPGFPEIPGGVLALLGISASSYTVSKAIQSNKDQTPDSGQAAIKK